MKTLTLASLLLGGALLTTNAFAQSPNANKKAFEKPARPELPDAAAKRGPASPEVKQMLADFQKAREAYFAERKKTLDELKTSTEEERAKLRDELKDKHAAWVEEQKKFRERLKEVRETLKDHADKVKDETGAGDTGRRKGK